MSSILLAMNAKVHSLLAELRVGLQPLYGGRLHDIYLYGSYARGEDVPESDVDVLIVLDAVPSYAAEVDRTGALVASLSLKHSISISRVFVSHVDWQRGQSPFLQNTREEAIAA